MYTQCAAGKILANCAKEIFVPHTGIRTGTLCGVNQIYIHPFTPGQRSTSHIQTLGEKKKTQGKTRRKHTHLSLWDDIERYTFAAVCIPPIHVE